MDLLAFLLTLPLNVNFWTQCSYEILCVLSRARFGIIVLGASYRGTSLETVHLQLAEAIGSAKIVGLCSIFLGIQEPIINCIFDKI